MTRLRRARAGRGVLPRRARPSCRSRRETGEGLERLARRAARAGADRSAEEREARVTRLPIDRAFLDCRGSGRSSRAASSPGRSRRDQKLELLPGRRPVRVRRLEVHGREEEVARAGERVSANLAGVELADLRRGMVLAPPGALPCVGAAARPARLLLGCSAAGERRARLVSPFLERDAGAACGCSTRRTLAPGGSARAQLRLSRRSRRVPGDRFVVRRLSPVETIGGGVVLDPLPAGAARKLDAGGARRAGPLETGGLAERLILWVEQAASAASPRRSSPRAPASMRRRCGTRSRRPLAERPPPRPAPLARSLPQRGRAGALASAGRRLLAGAALRDGGRRGRVRGARFCSGCFPAPSRGGPRRSRRRSSRAASSRSPARRRGLPGESESAAPSASCRKGSSRSFASAGSTRPRPPKSRRRSRHRQGGRRPDRLSREEGRARAAARRLDRRARRRRRRRRAAARAARASLDVAEFKEMFGLTRRLAIPLLEYLDGAKVTRRVGDRREILPG